MTGSHRIRAALLALALLTGIPESAHALALHVFQLSITPNGTDRFVLAGELAGGGSLDGVGTVTLAVDRFTFDVPVDDAARKHHKLTYRSPGPGLTHFVLDVRKRHISATGAGLALSGLPNPLDVSVTTGSKSDCATIRLRQRNTGGRRRRTGTRTRPIRWTLARDQLPPSCQTVEIALVDPRGLPVGTPTPVRVVARPPVGSDSVQLFRVDPTGRPTGTALCMLHDDGGAGDDIAGDGLYSCLATLAEPSATTIPLVVEATAGGVLVTSSGFSVQVVPPLGAADAATIVALQDQAFTIWSQASQRLGDTLAARVETVRVLRTMPSIVDAAIGANDLDITIHFPSGVIGGLMLSPRSDAGLTPPASIGMLGGSDVPSTPGADMARSASGAQIGNGNALLWNAGFFPNTELPAIQQILTASEDPAFTVTMRGRAQATVDGLRDLASFGTVALVTHGELLDDRRIVFLTSQEATPGVVFGYATDLQAGRLVISSASYTGTRYIAVAPEFISELSGRFDGAVIYAGLCHSLQNKTLSTSFQLKGASAYFGFDRSVYSNFAAAIAPKVFCGMVSDHVSAADAYAPIMPKTDLNEPRRYMATLNLDGDALYPGTIGPPSSFGLTPPQVCLQQGQSVLFSAMPGTGPTPFAPCVTYNWTNTAIAGHLTGGSQSTPETVASTDPTATYTRTAATDATDTVGVTILDVNDTKLGTVVATVLAATDPRCMTTTTTTTTTTTSTSTITMCTLPAPFISGCADFTISPDVVPVGGTFSLSIDYTSGGGAPCNASACAYCGAYATVVSIDGAAPTDPSMACGLTPGTHTVVFTANFAACPAWCYVAEPGNWGTGHPFIIGE